jgi:hypothetical protein
MSTTTSEPSPAPERLTRVKLKNFFGIGEEGIDIPLGRRLTMFYGPNGVGKSTLQRVFEYLFGKGEQARIWRRDWWRVPSIPDHMRHANASVECELELQFDTADSSAPTVLTFTWPAWSAADSVPVRACRISVGTGRARRRWLVWETLRSYGLRGLGDDTPNATEPEIVVAPATTRDPWGYREDPIPQDGKYLHVIGDASELKRALQGGQLARLDLVRGDSGLVLDEVRRQVDQGAVSASIAMLVAEPAWTEILPSSRIKPTLFGDEEQPVIGFGIQGHQIECAHMSTGERVISDVILTVMMQLHERVNRRLDTTRFAGGAARVLQNLGASPSRHVRSKADLLVLEEPETHLHATTQASLMRWLIMSSPDSALYSAIVVNNHGHLFTGDEPTNPEVLKDLGDLRNAATEWFPTLIIETHSTNLLRAVQDLVAEGSVDKDDISILVFSGGNGEPTEVVPMPMSEEGSLLRLWPGPKP